MIVAIYIFALSVAILESIFYPGVFQSHTHIPALVIYLFGLFALTRSRHYRGLTALTIIVSTLYLVLNLIESFTYDNFVFSYFHINLQGFEYLTIFFLFSAFLSRSHGPEFKQLARSSITASIAFLIIRNLSGLVPMLVSNLTPIIQRPLASYDTKMESAYPGFYPAMQLVADLTPSDATIIIPPQAAPWVTEGNEVFVQRFLYPRAVAHLTDNTVYSGNTYLLIARGSWPTDGSYEHGWPKTPVAATQIWEFDLENHTSSSFDRDYDPAQEDWNWGLIEAKHD